MRVYVILSTALTACGAPFTSSADVPPCPRELHEGERAVGHKATADELPRMKALLAQSLAQDAMDFSSTISPTHNDADGNPVPSRHAGREELVELARLCRDYEGTSLEFLPALGDASPT